MTTQAEPQSGVHLLSLESGSQDNPCLVSTFEISELILNQASASSEPNELGLTVSPTWGAGWGRSSHMGLSRSRPFLG